MKKVKTSYNGWPITCFLSAMGAAQYAIHDKCYFDAAWWVMLIIMCVHSFFYDTRRLVEVKS